ncbi:hypothetical protein VDGE_30192 [Verticillium dahliae]|uniref:Uncharacterized protein n=1 Tax=Verticillium dahliae TaxID=27337 RepID=A0A444RWR0_VERDA|nr:hypothetical protein VDGE_30192 [Verticillium dahliae]
MESEFEEGLQSPPSPVNENDSRHPGMGDDRLDGVWLDQVAATGEQFRIVNVVLVNSRDSNKLSVSG